VFRYTLPALVAGAIGALALASGALAAEPAPEDLNPPPPAFLTCKALGAGTICSGARELVKEPELQPELVCGSGADAFIIHDNATLNARATRWYDADGNLTRRVLWERWKPAFFSNPLSGKTVPYTQTNKITTVLAVPGDFASATETIVGENIYTDPVTHRKVLRSTGRSVFGADGELDFRAGQQPFLDAFVEGDMSVFDELCAALA
jgi:hypothetical protein